MLRRSSSLARSLLATGLTWLTLAASPGAQAALLPVNTIVALPTGTTVAAEPQLAGTVIDTLINNFSFVASSGTVSGTIESRVIRAVDGTLDFYWQVSSSGNSSDALGSFRLGEIYTSQYLVNWRSDSTGDRAPVSANRFGGSQSSYFNFTFTTTDDTGALVGLAAGETSYFMFLDTDATNYDLSGIMDVADVPVQHISGIFSTFAPAADVVTVPEPGSLALAGLALGLLAVRRRQA